MKPEFERAAELYQKLADKQGDLNAMHMLGLIYHEGLGLAQDPLKVSPRYDGYV